MVDYYHVFSLGMTLEQQQNTELTFFSSASNKEEDDSNKPRSREIFALPSEEQAVDKRQRRFNSDNGHSVQTAVTAVSLGTLRSRFVHFTANDKLRFAVNGFTLPVCPYLGLKTRRW